MEIYKATNNITGKSYIGYATDGLKKRKSEHISSAKNDTGSYFHNSLRKYGLDNFSWMVLEHNVSDFEMLEELEIYWIREFNTKIPNGYNLTDGGGGTKGFKYTEEAKRKLSESHKRYTEEIRERARNLRKVGISWNSISAMLQIPAGSIREWCKDIKIKRVFKFTKELKMEAIELRNKGLYWREISEKIGIHMTPIRKCYEKYKKEELNKNG